LFVTTELAEQAVELHRRAPTRLDIELDEGDEIPANTEIRDGVLHRRRGRPDITPVDRIPDDAPIDLNRARRAVELSMLGAIGTVAQSETLSRPDEPFIDFQVTEAADAARKQCFVPAVKERIAKSLKIQVATPSTGSWLDALASEFYQWVKAGSRESRLAFFIGRDRSLFLRQYSLRAKFSPLR
jgi:hypothetical protein